MCCRSLPWGRQPPYGRQSPRAGLSHTNTPGVGVACLFGIRGSYEAFTPRCYPRSALGIRWFATGRHVWRYLRS